VNKIFVTIKEDVERALAQTVYPAGRRGSVCLVNVNRKNDYSLITTPNIVARAIACSGAIIQPRRLSGFRPSW